MESILTSIKKLLGIEENDDHFDSEIIPCINTVLDDLTQLGVGPSEGYVIEDATSTWVDFLSNGESQLRMERIKSYTHLRVKLLFDPPDSAAHISAIERQIDKLEWRINVAAESK